MIGLCRPRTPVCVVILACWCVGCSRLPPPANPLPAASNDPGNIDAILDPLRKAPDLAACRSVLQQLNAHFNRYPERRPLVLTSTELNSLRQALQLNEGELEELANPGFTLLDAHHLEQCFLLRDAAESLQCADQPPAVRAAVAFAWVVRQVQLVESNDEAAPVVPVLRRGWGTDRERSLIFLALLEQLDVPGCMIALPGSPPAYWIPGALADGKVLLFDTRLGVPLPGPNGKGIATLDDIRTQPAILKSLAEFAYDVAPEQGAKAEVHLVCALSSLSARMQHLERLLASLAPCRVSRDPIGKMLEAWKVAGDNPRFWPLAIRLLRQHLRPDQGGNDQTQWKQRQFELSLTPWHLLPRPVQQIPDNVELGIRLRNEFEQPFVGFFGQPGSPRDLMLRGRWNEAVSELIKSRDDLIQFSRLAREDSGLADNFAAWCHLARKSQEDLLVARRRLSQEDSATNRQFLAQVEARFDQLWKDWPKQRRALYAAAAVPLLAETTALLARVKQEQAERIQSLQDRSGKTGPEDQEILRDAWLAADEWWQRCLDENPIGTSALAARLGKARALQGLNRYPEAIAVLESTPNLQGWNARMVLYRIRELRGR